MSSPKNFPLAPHVTAKRLTFVDIPARLEEEPSMDGALVLRTLYENIGDTLAEQSEVLVMIEDLTHLTWIGVSSVEITRFYRAIRHLCLQVGSRIT